MPNFFISAFVYDDHKYIATENIRKHTSGDGMHCTNVSYQFPDRLFDRDTLFLSQYDVNFLYVLYLYARNKSNEKAAWKDVLKEKIEAEMNQPVVPDKWLTLHYLERDLSMGILVGYYKSEEHLQWILGKNDKGSLVYNVRLRLKDEEPRAGAHYANFYKEKDVKFVILYIDGAEENGEYRVFHVKDTAQKVTEDRMRETWYPMNNLPDTLESDRKSNRNYFFFRFDEEVTIGNLRFADMLKDIKRKHYEEFGSYKEGEPMFATAEWVKDYKQV